MKLIGVEINNYKSFGEEENFLYVNDLNVIIGKNESGKSNLIDFLKDVGYVNLGDEKIFSERNRSTEKEVTAKFIFETRNQEKFFYRNYTGKVIVDFQDEKNITINEEFGEYIISLPEYKTRMENLRENAQNAPITKFENKKKLEQVLNLFENVDNKLFIEPQFLNDFIKTLKTSLNGILKELANSIESMINFLENIYMNFPDFIKIENISLQNSYTIKELEEELDEYNFNSILYQLFNICNIDSKNLMNAMKSNNSTRIRMCEEEIQKKINEVFVKEFNKFYSQEELIFAIDITTDKIDIMIKSASGAYLKYNERSNGFKWYVNIFIQLLYKEKNSGKSTSHILLLDEPGVRLHANAQKELQKLLNRLSKGNEQIIYTTHSPFMIDKDELLAIRAVIKDDVGYTHIYNKVTTIPTSEKSRYETITPILYSIGCEEVYDIGPSFSELNIITEGVTDYFCLEGYFECIKEKTKLKIIPSNGANDVQAIASILFGWNCNFVILLDKDKKGKDIYKSIKDTNSPFIDRVIFVDSTTDFQGESKFEIEDLFSETDRKKFGLIANDYEEKKYNYITDMLTKIKCGEETYDDETKEKFKELFNQIEKFKKI